MTQPLVEQAGVGWLMVRHRLSPICPHLPENGQEICGFGIFPGGIGKTDVVRGDDPRGEGGTGEAFQMGGGGFRLDAESNEIRLSAISRQVGEA